MAELNLPANVQPDKSYLIQGSTIIAWRDALQRDRALAGTGLLETGTPKGRLLSLDPSAPSATSDGLNFYLKILDFWWSPATINGIEVMEPHFEQNDWELIKFTDGRAVEHSSGSGSEPSIEAGYFVIQFNRLRLQT